MKKIMFLFLLFICCVITSCNKWELSDEEVLYGTVKCIEKKLQAILFNNSSCDGE